MVLIRETEKNKDLLPIIGKALAHAGKIAVIDANGDTTYSDLFDHAKAIAAHLVADGPLNGEAVAYMVNPGAGYVASQWAIWLAGGMAVPLCLTHPLPSLQYVLEDSGAKVVVLSPEYAPVLADHCAANGIRSILLTEIALGGTDVWLPNVALAHRAMMLYTSGTTNKPKGVVTTHANIAAQVSVLVEAWEWSSDDQVLCVLPLHHVHGIINVVSCAMYSGAVCRFLPSFSAEAIFDVFLEGKTTLFMAVPTIYYKLIAHWESLPVEKQAAVSAAMKAMRLMVCGSAALPVSTMERWEAISGHVLLERYGMTEIGMAISNPYRGKRKAGHVGLPLPGVGVRIVDDSYRDVEKGTAGEILVKGPNVFQGYWQRPEATQETFTEDGWFKTGDVAITDEDGYYRILGRKSVDIIKSGGYKISALEIEETLRLHPSIADCAVVGIDDDEWGELIVAALVTTEENLDLNALNQWVRGQMAGYKSPRKYKLVPELPRNAMGKVVKGDVKKLFA